MMSSEDGVMHEQRDLRENYRLWRNELLVMKNPVEPETEPLTICTKCQTTVSRRETELTKSLNSNQLILQRTLRSLSDPTHQLPHLLQQREILAEITRNLCHMLSHP